ncbi:MAG: hypothetical protein M0Z51_05150 [Propionibacterium sp.]|nr:hypothetical protein [Propionibacterium sp.]
MAVDTFIPEVWSAQLQVALAQYLVTGQPGVINRDYEGEIANQGDTVHIGAIGRPTVSTYTKNTTVLAPEVLATTDQSLLIDQAKSFDFKLDDVDKAQTRAGGQLLNRAAEEAAKSVAEVIDSYLLTLMSAGAGKILTPQAVGTADAAFLLLRQLNMWMNKVSAPRSGRWAVVSPEFEALVLGDPRFIDASKYGSSTPILNGEIGRAVGFNVMVSNQLPVGTAATNPAVSNFVIAGHGMATTFASQISKVEAFRPEASFSDAIKGLSLYGAKVVRPEGLVVCDVDVTVA